MFGMLDKFAREKRRPRGERERIGEESGIALEETARRSVFTEDAREKAFGFRRVGQVAQE